MVFWANSFLFLLLTLNMFCIGLGTLRPWFNFFGVTLAPCICIAHLVIIIMTGTARFSAWGKLCALTTLPTNFEAKGEMPTNDWTYAKDGQLILVFWVLQVILFLSCFGVGLVPCCRGTESNRIVDMNEIRQTSSNNDAS